MSNNTTQYNTTKYVKAETSGYLFITHSYIRVLIKLNDVG
jgi:hypothetical protein